MGIAEHDWIVHVNVASENVPVSSHAYVGLPVAIYSGLHFTVHDVSSLSIWPGMHVLPVIPGPKLSGIGGHDWIAHCNVGWLRYPLVFSPLVLSLSMHEYSVVPPWETYPAPHLTLHWSPTVSTWPNVQALLLEFTTHELVKNQRVKLNRSFEGTCSDIVENILKNELKTKKKLFIEPSDGIKKYVFPNIDPFTAINMIKREAVTVSDGAPTFMFYEDLRGYHFRSLSSMYERTISQEYNPSVVGSKAGTKPIDSFNDMRSILGMHITGNGDTLLGTFAGEYGSKLTVYDTYCRRFKNYTYNYLDSFKTEQHISTEDKVTSGSGKDDFPLISATPVENNSRISDFPAKTFLRSTANKVTPGEVENTNDDLLPFLLTIPLQKLAYYSALKKGYDIDKPRNLAKSVTVE